MQTITMPLWALIASVGLPSICLVWIVFALIRRRNLRRKASAVATTTAPLTAQVANLGQFRHDLLAQQIDIVFNGLNALVETERVKLNALLNQNLFSAVPSQPVPEADDASAGSDSGSSESLDGESPVGRQVAEAVAAGEAVDHVASQLGLSQAEVALALKLNQAKSGTPHRRLEAVA